MSSVLLRHLATIVVCLGAVALVWWRLRQQVTVIVHRVERIEPAERPVLRAVFITGRGAACPECLGMFPTTFGLGQGGGVPGGWADHVLDEHPASALADDVRYLRAHAWRTQSLS